MKSIPITIIRSNSIKKKIKKTDVIKLHIYTKHTQQYSYGRAMYPAHDAEEKLADGSILGQEYLKKHKDQQEVAA